MGSNFIPRADAAFDAWQNTFADYAAANPDKVGLSEDDIAALNDARTLWKNDYPAQTSAEAAAAAAQTAKETSRAAYERVLRMAAKKAQAFGGTTDQYRRELQIPVRDPVPTRSNAPTTRPLLFVEPSNRLTHRFTFSDEATPTRKARPKGVVGVEVFLSLTAPSSAGGPSSVPLNELRHLALFTRTPATHSFAPEEGGRTAWYAGRWVSTRGEKGPWSETVSVTVAA